MEENKNNVEDVTVEGCAKEENTEACDENCAKKEKKNF